MTNKEKMFRMIINSPELQEKYQYKASDYRDLYDALHDTDNAVPHAIAMIVNELNGSEDQTVWKKVYTMTFQYLNDNMINL